MYVSGVPEKIVVEVMGHKNVKVFCQYERMTDQQFKAIGHSVSSMEPFEHMQLRPENKDGRGQATQP